MERQAQDTTIEIKGDWVDEITKGYNEYIDLGQDYYSKEEKKAIYKWPNHPVFTSSSNDSYRIPHMASFGPYHHGEARLKPMERHKERVLYSILQRRRVSASSLVSPLRKVEQELRSNYDDLDDLKWPTDSFLRMMLLDGCFILELLRIADTQSVKDPKGKDPKAAHESFDHSLYMDGMLRTTVICGDMLMLENQIPLLVLKKLRAVLDNKEEVNNDELVELIIRTYRFKQSPNDEVGSQFVSFYKEQNYGPPLHILDVYRKCLVAKNKATEAKTYWLSCLDGLHFLRKVLKYMIIAPPIWLYMRFFEIPKPGHVRSAMRFHEAGIEFKANKSSHGVYIHFDTKKGVLHLPHIDIEDHTAVIYLNLMAFEMMHPELMKNQDVTSFVAFMDTLIDTAEDVHLLSSKGIVRNHLGSDEDAAKVFNKLCDGIVYSPDEDRDSQLQGYVASAWNTARADLKHNYFKNPWSVMSLLAAIVLLILTFIQTVK